MLPKLVRLGYFRRKKYLSHAELASRAGVAKTTIIAIEKGRCGAQYRTLRKIAEALDVSPEDLLGPTEPEKAN